MSEQTGVAVGATEVADGVEDGTQPHHTINLMVEFDGGI